LKLRDMKSLAFGKYITLVPSHNLSRHFDRPLPSSFARLHNCSMNPIKLAPRGIPGQQLIGVILPKTESEVLRYADDFASLAKRHLAVLRCLAALKSTESGSRLKRLARQVVRDEDLRAEVGYEVISCENDEFVGDTHDVGSKVETTTCNVAVLEKDGRSSVEWPVVQDEHLEDAHKESKSAKRKPKKEERLKSRDRKKCVVRTALRASTRSRTSRAALPDSKRSRLPTLQETEQDDECRECGEVEILWALPVRREGPGDDDDDDMAPGAGANDDDDLDPGQGSSPKQARVALNGSHVPVDVADDATVDLGSILFRHTAPGMNDDDEHGDHGSTSSCIVFFQQHHDLHSVIKDTPMASDPVDDAFVVPENVSFEDEPFSSDVSCMTTATKA
jgi:hypothetical protein